MTKSWRDEHPVWTGVLLGAAGVFVWYHRGVVMMLLGKLMHPKELFHGGLGQIIDIAKLGAATGIEMPSSDPSIAFRQMRRYAFAASQDKSPIVGLTHASYALIALDILEEAVGRDMLAARGCDVTKVRTVVTALQDAHAKKLEGCDVYLSSVLAMERGEPGGALPGAVFAGGGVEYIAPTGA